MNYTVQCANRWKLDEPGAASGHFLYEVLETTTNLIIKTDMTQSQAKALCRQLNFGGGFDGFTPAFFVEKVDFMALSEDDVV